ncbi:MAG: DUF3488 domain-containing protein [Phycisphaerales bacterium]|nr:DUF3488 domain-containing protein [Phycisphaerales bacterium]
MTRLSSWKSPTLILVLLAIAGFCLANDRLPMMLWAWCTGLAGWWLSERQGGRPLPRWIVLALVLTVLLWTGYRVNSQGLEVTVFCEFLTFVLLVKMWDRKRARDIAQLISMATFLVIGAILDNNSLAVGLVVLLCMPLSAWAVMALQLGAGAERSTLASSDARIAAAATLAHTPPHESPLPPRVSDSAARRLIPATALLTTYSFLLALGVFLVVPRGIAGGRMGSWGQASAQLRTGFTADVELGRAGLLSESQRTVMEVAFSDGANKPLGGEGQVYYLRGAVLSAYRDGRWTAGANSARATLDAAEPVFTDATRDRILLQDVDLRESYSDSESPLFAVWCPRFMKSPSAGLNTRPSAGQVWYRSARRTGPIRYTAHSVDQPVPTNVTERNATAGFDSEIVHTFTADILRNAELDPDPATRPPSQDHAVARILTGYLRGKFAYTTDIASPNPGQDPIEWFLTTERRGHCEYFASALAAMCRSVGIPARVIAGYVATEYDPARGIYTVRESNAHAWTEVQIGIGTWITFDATPPVAFMEIHEPQPSWRMRIARLMDSLNDTWTNSIVMFDAQQQRRVFDIDRLRMSWLEPVTRQAAEEYSQSRGRSLIKYMLVTAGALTALTALSVVATRAFAGLSRIVFRRTRTRTRSTARTDPHLRSLLQHAGFYDDALDLLAKAGIPKPDPIPPLTYANHLHQIDPTAANAFESLTLAYYQLRFARTPLTPAQIAHTKTQLEHLRAAITKPRA